MQESNGRQNRSESEIEGSGEGRGERGGGGVETLAGRPAAAAPGGEVIHENACEKRLADTPLTNRGYLKPKSGDIESETQIEFHNDYLRITAFCTLEACLDRVAEGLIERAGFDADWIDYGEAGRWGKLMRGGAGLVEVLEPRPTTSGRAWCVVEVKGEGCTFFGDDLQRGFLQHLTSCCVEWRGKRVDPCWDHVPFSPAMLYDAIERGDINSRVFEPEGRDIWQNSEGRTCYLRKLRGEKDRLLRLYDRRGFNRFEVQFQGAYADHLLHEFVESDVGDWSRKALIQVRGNIDFIDRKSNERAMRCALLPWWAKFVGEAKKPGRRRPAGCEPGRKVRAIGRSEQFIRRNAKWLRSIKRVFGADYLLDRIEHYGAGPAGPDAPAGPEQERFEQELEIYKFSGLAGLPGEAPEDPADLPI